MGGRKPTEDDPCLVRWRAADGLDTIAWFAPANGAHEPDYILTLRQCGFVVEPMRGPGARLQVDGAFAGIIDLGAGIDGQLVERIRDAAPQLRIVALIPRAEASGPALAALVEAGTIYDFHTLPVDADRLLHTLGHIRGLAAVERQNGGLVQGASEPYMVGSSEAMVQVYARIRKFAPFDAPVLITGETGTGKELAARAIHERSTYKDGPFVAINCAALPPTLIAAELFGYERGAFTGAQQRKIGRLESADGGTVFLDEIGDMPLEIQAHLLRFLQDRTIDRLGNTKPIRVQARVIVATNVHLEEAIREGRFREDLFYRLNVLSLRMPALRERGDDIDLLACYFLQDFARENHRRALHLSRNARVAIRRHRWPGNVRELISRVRRGAVLASNGLVTAADLGFEEDVEDRLAVTLAEAKADVERRVVLQALQANGNVVQRAARELGISRVALYRIMKRLDAPAPLQH